jgi:hypothetical protein
MKLSSSLNSQHTSFEGAGLTVTLRSKMVNSFNKDEETLTVLRWNSWTPVYQKTRVFCSMLFTFPSTGGFLKKTRLFTSFKNPYKKTAKQEKFESIHE